MEQTQRRKGTEQLQFPHKSTLAAQCGGIEAREEWRRLTSFFASGDFGCNSVTDAALWFSTPILIVAGDVDVRSV